MTSDFKLLASGLGVALSIPVCLIGGLKIAVAFGGEVPEWSIGAVSKTVDLLTEVRGFESHPLR